MTNVVLIQSKLGCILFSQLCMAHFVVLRYSQKHNFCSHFAQRGKLEADSHSCHMKPTDIKSTHFTEVMAVPHRSGEWDLVTADGRSLFVF